MFVCFYVTHKTDHNIFCMPASRLDFYNRFTSCLINKTIADIGGSAIFAPPNGFAIKLGAKINRKICNFN